MESESQVSTEAKQIHDKSFVFDAHIDTATHLLWRNPEFSARLDAGHVDIPRLREGGVDAAFFAVWINDEGSDLDAMRLTIREIDAIHRTIDANPDDLVLALDADDVVQAKSEGKIAVLISIEGGRCIDEDLGVLRTFYRLGVRSITLAWGAATGWIDSHNDERHGGLTDFGRGVVTEMQQLGMIVDISHVSDKSYWDVLEVAARPIFASHSCCRALQDHPRNMTDDMITSLGQADGVINVNFVAGFVGGDLSTGYRHSQKPDAAEMKDPFDFLTKKGEGEGPPISRLMDHFDHALKLAGTTHVGIGTDYDGASHFPIGLDDISKMPLVTEALLQRGHSHDVIAGVLGANDLKLFEKTL
ncbi:MAG: membrane dipeptidase [Chloroflexi bacterium]|nr:membrane dipeptidase [Chloroflexota bacterium]MBT5626821.1 membrane dipeptidase [Chloroflexota bacterium]